MPCSLPKPGSSAWRDDGLLPLCRCVSVGPVLAKRPHMSLPSCRWSTGQEPPAVERAPRRPWEPSIAAGMEGAGIPSLVWLRCCLCGPRVHSPHSPEGGRCGPTSVIWLLQEAAVAAHLFRLPSTCRRQKLPKVAALAHDPRSDL